jgi:hypothetical protein
MRGQVLKREFVNFSLYSVLVQPALNMAKGLPGLYCSAFTSQDWGLRTGDWRLRTED